MTDGTRLRQSWYKALTDSEDYFRNLLRSPASPDWKRVVITSDTSSSSRKGKARATGVPDLTDVIVHRKSNKSGDSVYRAVLDVPAGEDTVLLEPWKSVLMTPELRKEWDPAVESAELVEMFDPATRISKMKFSLGWPANPRDAVAISRTFSDATTLMDFSTSLPRSPDEPAYLRPSPPYVRSDVKLTAWLIQLIQPSPNPGESGSSPSGIRLRITCFWQHDLRAVWNFGTASGLSQQLCTMVLGLYKTVQSRGHRVPLLVGYGNGVAIERVSFDIDRQALTVNYSIVPEDEDHGAQSSENPQGLDLHAVREHRRLTRSIECALPSSRGWDVELSKMGSSEQVQELPWTAQAVQTSTSAPSSNSAVRDNEKFIFRVQHSPLPDDHSVLKVKLVIELSGPSSGLRLNGITQAIETLEERNPSSYFMSQEMLQDASSTADLSFHTASSSNTVESTASSSQTSTERRPTLTPVITERSTAVQKAIQSQVRRKYIYFSSLLQEPEAKWKPTSENRGVEVTQLDSIDPTLVVYKAEATFVGIGLWDLYGAIVTPGARLYWDKQHEDSVLLEDVNELSELWQVKTKPAWPVTGRDSVLLRTVYKSPTSIHIFSFSADNPSYFSNVPPVDPTVIRTQVDLQGWAIEALSPTTTLLTLVEQSDPKGWSNKSSIPQQMITAVAGVGEFAIKCGGPPAATRLAGAKANDIRYDHDRGQYRIQYEASMARPSANCSSAASLKSNDSSGVAPTTNQMPTIECEIRCDMDTWASSLDIVVDPPPQSISCLRRHKLSANGGGLWLTVGHDAVFAADERILAIVRKGPGKERGLVMVNGVKANVDVEELPEHEAKRLAKRKRVKPARIPLDQPPVLGVIRRRRAEWDGDGDSSAAEASDASNTNGRPSPSPSSPNFMSTAPKFPSPLAKFFTMAMEQAATTTQQAVAAISPATAAGDGALPSASRPPMQHLLEALSYVQSYHSRVTSDDWTLVSEKGFPVHRKTSLEVSQTIPVHKGEKVIEGVPAEEIASAITSYGCRKQWDDRFDSATIFEEYGAGCHTAFVITKGGFPFRDRGFYLASMVARARPRPTSPSALSISRRNSGVGDTEQDNRAAIFCISSSFSADSVVSYAPDKYNPHGLPVGRVFVDAWILETLDPYADESYAIPSTRCTRLVAVDYAGSIPAALNSMINGMLPKSILAMEAYMKNLSPLPCTRLPATGLVFSEAGSQEPFVEKAWSIRRRDSDRLMVSTAYLPDDKVYRSCVLVVMNPAPSDRPDDTTPRPSRILTNPIVAEPTTISDNNSSISINDAMRQRTHSLRESLPARRRSPSRNLRTSSSAFTLRGEVKPQTDFLLAEIIVDSKLYPDGYTVQLRSRMRDSTDQRIALAVPSTDASSEAVLPIMCTIHTLPSSPLRSAGLSAERPPQHLLRLTLPTAQYQKSTIQDPLTDETRSVPPKPQWLNDIREKGAVVGVEIRPSSAKANGNKQIVLVDGKEVAVIGEKESLTSLGRDELQNNRVSKMAVLSRVSAAEEILPEELKAPVAVAEYLLDPAAIQTLTARGTESTPTEESNVDPEKGQEPGESASSTRDAPAPTSLAPSASSGGLLSFLQSYPNPLLRFTSGGSSQANTPETASSVPLAGSRPIPEALSELVSQAVATTTATVAAAKAAQSGRTYPLSTVIVIALIMFLLGSLLRSLLSPADFVYVATDLKEAGDEASTGWREIRRLLEIKYLAGGWDFQIAVVRRH